MTEGILSPGLRLTAVVAGAIALLASLQGCFGIFTRPDNDVAVGEEHEVDFPPDQTYVMTQDVLRGQGILYDRDPGHKIITLWKPADKSEGTFSNLIGSVAQYRYEIEV